MGCVHSKSAVKYVTSGGSWLWSCCGIIHLVLYSPMSWISEQYMKHTWCGRKVMRLVMLCTNQQCCCLLLHMAVRFTPAVDSVQVWTCYSCYATVEVVFVRCVTKMDRQKFEWRAIKFCVKLGESATVTYEKLQRAYGEHSLSRAQVFRWHKSILESREQVEDEPSAGRPSNLKNGQQCGKSEVRSSSDVDNDQ